MLFRTPSQRSFTTEQLDQRLRAGLVGHWIGGGSGNTWFDRSGYGNHGALVGGPTWTLGEGGKRSALQFDGVDDYVNCGDVLDMGTNSLTIAFWFRTTSTAVQALVGKSSSRDLTGRYSIYLTATDTIEAFLDYGAEPAVSTSTAGYRDGSWHHAAITYNRTGSETIYLDGVSKASTSISAGSAVNMQNSDPLYFAEYQNSTGTGPAGVPLRGALDDVRIYNRTLTAEIALLASPSFSPVVAAPRFVGRRAATGNRRRRLLGVCQ